MLLDFNHLADQPAFVPPPIPIMREYPMFQFDITQDIVLVLLANILHAAIRNPLASPFLYPVDELYAPGYYKAIKTPMDFSAIQKKLKKKDSPLDLNAFILCIKQIFENCYTYNFEGSSIYTQAQQLENFFFDSLFNNMANLVELAKTNPIIMSAKQMAVVEPIINFHIPFEIMKKCRSILRKISGHKCGYWFRQPVDINELPNYFQVVEVPMDLSTIRKRLEQNHYLTDELYQSDVKLIFSNAKLFNPPMSQVYKDAEFMEEYFYNEWNGIAHRVVVPVAAVVVDMTMNNEFYDSEEFAICCTLLKRVQGHLNAAPFLVRHCFIFIHSRYLLMRLL